MRQGLLRATCSHLYFLNLPRWQPQCRLNFRVFTWESLALSVHCSISSHDLVWPRNSGGMENSKGLKVPAAQCVVSSTTDPWEPNRAGKGAKPTLALTGLLREQYLRLASIIKTILSIPAVDWKMASKWSHLSLGHLVPYCWQIAVLKGKAWYLNLLPSAYLGCLLLRLVISIIIESVSQVRHLRLTLNYRPHSSDLISHSELATPFSEDLLPGSLLAFGLKCTPKAPMP